MMYHGSGLGAGWALVLFAVVLPTLLLVAGLVLAGFHRESGPSLHRDSGPSEPPPPVPDAEAVLAGRFARGEIEPEDYEQRLRTLRATRR